MAEAIPCADTGTVSRGVPAEYLVHLAQAFEQGRALAEPRRVCDSIKNKT